MTGRGGLAARLGVMERGAGAGQVVFVIPRMGEPADAAVRRRFGIEGPPHGARVVLMVTGIERADDDGARP
jgi:hypothetical protein